MQGNKGRVVAINLCLKSPGLECVCSDNTSYPEALAVGLQVLQKGPDGGGGPQLAGPFPHAPGSLGVTLPLFAFWHQSGAKGVLGFPPALRFAEIPSGGFETSYIGCTGRPGWWLRSD